MLFNYSLYTRLPDLLFTTNVTKEQLSDACQSHQSHVWLHFHLSWDEACVPDHERIFLLYTQALKGNIQSLGDGVVKRKRFLMLSFNVQIIKSRKTWFVPLFATSKVVDIFLREPIIASGAADERLAGDAISACVLLPAGYLRFCHLSQSVCHKRSMITVF